MRRSPRTGAGVRAAIVTLVALLVAGVVPADARAPQLRRYVVLARTTTGASSAGAGPLLRPGRYVDTFPDAGPSFDDGTPRFYRVHLTRGTEPVVTATVIPPGPPRPNDPGLGVHVVLQAIGKDAGCSHDASETASTSGTDLDVATAVLQAGTVGGADWGDCPTDADWSLQVARRGSAYAGQPVRVELGIRVQPAVGGATDPVPATAQAYVAPQVTTPERTVIGGTGFDDAPLLPTGRYRDSFVTGERRYYRVHLDWGQRVAWTMTAAQLPQVKDFSGSDGAVDVVSPLRQVLAQSDRAQNTGSDLGATTGALYGSSLVPVRYANRTSSDSDVEPYSAAGDYYLVVSTAYPTGSDPTITVPYQLVVQVLGTPAVGPSYAVSGSARPQAGGSTHGTAVLVSSVVAALVVVLVVVGLIVLRRRQRVAHR